MAEAGSSDSESDGSARSSSPEPRDDWAASYNPDVENEPKARSRDGRDGPAMFFAHDGWNRSQKQKRAIRSRQLAEEMLKNDPEEAASLGKVGFFSRQRRAMGNLRRMLEEESAMDHQAPAVPGTNGLTRKQWAHRQQPTIMTFAGYSQEAKLRAYITHVFQNWMRMNSMLRHSPGVHAGMLMQASYMDLDQLATGAMDAVEEFEEANIELAYFLDATPTGGGVVALRRVLARIHFYARGGGQFPERSAWFLLEFKRYDDFQAGYSLDDAKVDLFKMAMFPARACALKMGKSLKTVRAAFSGMLADAMLAACQSIAMDWKNRKRPGTGRKRAQELATMKRVKEVFLGAHHRHVWDLLRHVADGTPHVHELVQDLVERWHDHRYVAHCESRDAQSSPKAWTFRVHFADVATRVTHALEVVVKPGPHEFVLDREYSLAVPLDAPSPGARGAGDVPETVHSFVVSVKHRGALRDTPPRKLGASTVTNGPNAKMQRTGAKVVACRACRRLVFDA